MFQISVLGENESYAVFSSQSYLNIWQCFIKIIIVSYSFLNLISTNSSNVEKKIQFLISNQDEL